MAASLKSLLKDPDETVRHKATEVLSIIAGIHNRLRDCPALHVQCFNPLTSKPAETGQTLFCLMPDDFTRQCGTPER